MAVDVSALWADQGQHLSESERKAKLNAENSKTLVETVALCQQAGATARKRMTQYRLAMSKRKREKEEKAKQAVKQRRLARSTRHADTPS